MGFASVAEAKSAAERRAPTPIDWA
jgi:hypothetical protein